MYENHLLFAKAMAKKGGAILKKHFGKLKPGEIMAKGRNDIVTWADKTVEALYAKEITEAFPEHGILGEEGASRNPDSEFLWVLDPLDGTKNYSVEVPFFCTMICLLRHKKPVVSVIYEPLTNRLFSAMEGKGAWENGKRIHVSDKTDLADSMILYCHSLDSKSIQKAEHLVTELKILSKDTSRLRSAGLEMAMVARGLCEAYLLGKMPLWDLAAGALLIREAGGKATDFSGKEWEPGDSTILVSNGTALHEEILKLIGGA